MSNQVRDDKFDTEEVCLDANHTHLLLVDDGSQHKFGTERQLFMRIQKLLTDGRRFYNYFTIIMLKLSVATDTSRR